MRKRWTEAESEQLRQLYPTTLGKDLAKMFNCEVAQVYNRANKLGLNKDKNWLNDYYKRITKGTSARNFNRE